MDVQRERRLSGCSSAAKSALAAFLALFLIMAGTVSASHLLHQSFHRDGAVSGHSCLVCSLAKGQVSAAEVAVISAILVFCCVRSFRFADPSSLPGFDYCLSPGRAPPRS